LKTADKGVVDFLLEEVTTCVVLATPTPEVLAIAVDATLIEDGSTNSPHGDAEAEEKDGKASVVDGNFLGPSVTTSRVAPENENARYE